MDSRIYTGLSYMYEPEFNRAILPLLEAGDVDALEWSFDTVKTLASLPTWTAGLLKEFATADRLYGHGVYYSILSGAWHQRHTDWLLHLEAVQQEYKFQHISEHFGFMTSSNAHEGAPLPIPLSNETLDLGIQRLKQLSDSVKVPVGIENLAFSFSLQDVQLQGRFLKDLILPVDGFILLDLHNIYCQSANFGISTNEIINSYPLNRVKEIHVSGGSWEDSPYTTRPIRRDTHNNAIPKEVYDLLKDTIPKCPNLEVVILERLGDTFTSITEEQEFQHEFLAIKSIVQSFVKQSNHWPFNDLDNRSPFISKSSNASIAQQQTIILGILKTSANPLDAQKLLLNHVDLDQQLWQMNNWQLSMIDTAMQLGVKWGINYPKEY